jgi:hypothetical protein
MKPAGRIRGRDRPGRQTGLSADETRVYEVRAGLRPLHAAYPDRRWGDPDRDGLDFDGGRFARMAHADRSLETARDQDAVRVPEVRSVPRRAPLGRWCVVLPWEKLRKPFSRLSAQAEILPEHRSA